MNKKNTIIIAGVIILLVAWSLISSKTETQEDMLKRLQINESSFSKLPLCSQINIFSEVGSKFIDMDHGNVNAPKWMYDAIKKNDENTIAECIKEEVDRNLEAIKGNSDSVKRIFIPSQLSLANGCSINSTPIFANCGIFACASSKVHPAFASILIIASVCSLNAFMMAMSSLVPNFIL